MTAPGAAAGDEARHAAWATALAADGYVVVADFLPPAEVAALRARAAARRAGGEFRAAGIGAGAARQQRPEIRGDQILWLEPGDDPAEAALLARLEYWRLALNRELQLGLWELECHFAVYPPGAGYARHLDRPAGSEARVLSAVVYLNEGWCAGDGGELVLWLDDSRSVTVAPQAGTAVFFLSERFWHEVRPATRERWSVTGWFRRRG